MTTLFQKLWVDAERGVHFEGETAVQVATMIRDIRHSTGIVRLTLFISALARLLRAPVEDYHLLSKKTFIPSRRNSVYQGTRKAISFILNHFQEGLSVEQVLEHTGMSRATFSRQFKKHTGKTFTRFVKIRGPSSSVTTAITYGASSWNPGAGRWLITYVSSVPFPDTASQTTFEE